MKKLLLKYVLVSLLIVMLAIAHYDSYLDSAFAHSGTPVYSIIFPVAGRNSYSDSFGAPRSGGRTHQGVDIFANKCTPVVACVSGYIDPTMFGFHPTAGYRLWINGIDGHRYFYAHLNNDTPGTDDGVGGPAYAPGIGPRAWVNAGQPIGYVGDSGNAEGTPPHLHFEIHPNWGEAVCPYPSLISSSQPPWAHHVTYEAHSTPSSLRVNEYKGDVPVTVRNTGIATWPAGGGNPVHLSYHWVDADTYRTVYFEGLRTGLPYDVVPNESVNLLAQIQAPSYPGMYILRWDMVQEGVSWFSYKLVLTLDARVAVDYKTDAEYATCLYRGILGRDPDSAGLEGWTNSLARGLMRCSAAHIFLSSTERCNGYVTNLYIGVLERWPDPAEISGWSRAMSNGLPDEVTKAAFYGSNEYFQHFCSSSNDEYVTSLYQDILGRDPLEIEKWNWVNALNNGWSRTNVALAFINSREYRSIFISNLYVQVLEREADTVGLNGWLNALETGATQRPVIAYFYGSREYSLVK